MNLHFTYVQKGGKGSFANYQSWLVRLDCSLMQVRETEWQGKYGLWRRGNCLIIGWSVWEWMRKEEWKDTKDKVRKNKKIGVMVRITRKTQVGLDQVVEYQAKIVDREGVPVNDWEKNKEIMDIIKESEEDRLQEISMMNTRRRLTVRIGRVVHCRNLPPETLWGPPKTGP